jgi:hypothetical protein
VWFVLKTWLTRKLEVRDLFLWPFYISAYTAVLIDYEKD